MRIYDIKQKLSDLAKEHDAVDPDELWEAEIIESATVALLVNYCEEQGYLINGFPTEKRKELADDEADDYFCAERFQLYLDMLTLDKPDVADLTWFYTTTFWPDAFESKETFLKSTRSNVESGLYEVSL